MSKILDEAVDQSARVRLDADWSVVPLVAGLVGGGCEPTPRNRGSDVQVAPILPLEGGLWAWLGYREEWAKEPSAGKVKRFSFKAVGVTVHFGYKNILNKPQMFRAEWAGWARWSSSSDYGYQAGLAGHPHWQFDALESLQGDDEADHAATLLSVLRSEAGDAGPRDFAPQSISGGDVGDVIAAQKLSRIHFASAASWWKAVPNNSHTHAPDTVADVQAWVSETVAYIKRELGRLQPV